MSKKNSNVDNQVVDETLKKLDDSNIDTNELENQDNDVDIQVVDETSKKLDDSNIDTNELENKDNDVDNKVVDETSKKYLVIHEFRDLEDSNHVYHVNQVYPHEHISDDKKINALSEQRIEALTTVNNKIGEILIKLFEE